MKILVTPTSLKPDTDTQAMRRLKDYADTLVFNPYGRPLKEEELNVLLPGCDGMIAGLDFITERALAAADKLKVISRYGTGCDRVDLAAAKKHGIAVTNTPGANAGAVAEMAFGIMLCLARKIPMLDKKTKSGEWVRSTGMELGGKTLGILGLGAIGRHVAAQAQGFSMHVIAYDPYLDAAYASAHGITGVSLEKLIESSDIISMHLPLNEQTKHLINADKISRMKDGVMIVNTARGGLIDEAAALIALESGKIGGLGLDAFEKEPPEQTRLFEMENVVLTPHAAAHTYEATENMANISVDNLIRVLSGQECVAIVNK